MNRVFTKYFFLFWHFVLFRKDLVALYIKYLHILQVMYFLRKYHIPTIYITAVIFRSVIHSLHFSYNRLHKIDIFD